MQRNAAWIAAIALGAAALALQLAPAALAPPVPCPGVLERAAITAAHIVHGAPFGLWVLRVNRVIFFVAIALFARAAIAASGSWLPAVAVTLAFAASPLFAPAMSAFDPLVAAAAGLVACVALDVLPVADHARRWSLGLCLAAIVLAIPPVAFPSWAMPPLPPPFDVASGVASCAWPSMGSAVPGVAAAVASVGTYGVLLGVLALFARRATLLSRRASPLILYVAAALLAAATRDAPATRALAPAIVMLWLLAAAGLAEVVTAAGPSLGGRIGAVILAAIVPLGPLAARYRSGQPQPILASTFGHDRMTLDGLRRTLQLLPAQSVLVTEDAMTDLLLRASSATWQRSGKTLRLVDAQPNAVAAAASDSAWQVFALPASQTDLPKLGFQLSDDTLPGVSGMSSVKAGGACRPIDETWRAIDVPHAASMLVLRSEKLREEGAAAIWFGSARPISLVPVGWPNWVMPGFLPVAYSQADKPRLEQDAAQDGLAGREPVLDQPHIVRLEVWKLPDAPRLLAISLGADPPALILAHATPGLTMQVCPGYIHPARSIAFPK